MKRILSPFLILLLVGAAFNLIVTWSVAIWTGSVTFDAQLTAKLRRQAWDAEERSGEPQREDVWIHQSLHGTGVDVVIIKRYQPVETVYLHRAGWPLRAMEGESRTKTGGKPQSSWAVPLSSMVTLRAELIKGKVKVLTNTTRRIVPLRPVWLGFLGNTAIYAVVGMGMVGCAWLVRRAYRRRRGRCLACGYDLRGDVDRGCPECGDKRGEP